MRELFLLLKYVGLYPSYQIKISQKHATRKSRALTQVFVTLVGVLPAGIFVYLTNYKLFSSFRNLPQNLAQQVGAMFLNFSLTIFSIFYVVGFVGNAMYSLARNDETEYLLTLPIRRQSLVLYNILVSSNSQFYTVAFLLGAVLGYASGLELNLLSNILRVFLHVYFLTSISLLLALAFGGLASRDFVRKLNVLLTLGLIFVYFGFSYIYDAKLPRLQFDDKITERFARWFLFVNSDYNLFSWTFSSKGVFFLASLLISAVASTIFIALAPKLAFEPTLRKVGNQSSKKTARLFENWWRMRNGLFAIFWKDWKLLRRNEQFLFLILYPLGLGIFMILVSAGSARYLSLPFIGVSVFYCAIEAGILLSKEMLQREFSLTLPVKAFGLFFSKLLIPTSLNVALFALIALISFLIGRFDKFILLLFPIHVLLLILSSLVGAYFSLKRPGKSKNQAFDVVAVFVIQGITFGLAFSILMPTSALIYGKNLSQMEVLTHKIILSLGITCALFLLVFFARKLIKMVREIG